MTNVTVPESFLLAPYFQKDEIITTLTDDTFKLTLKKQPLLFDIYDQLQVDSQVKPWEKKYFYIPILIENWQETEPGIIELFKVRDRKQVLFPMKIMILTFIAMLFWTNGKAVPGLIKITDQVKKLSVKPVNVEERLEFILSIPNQYHAFTQLKTLFSELEKKYAVLKLKEKG
ncbi:hypothetical protein RJD24_06490 [Bacillaceae bacterium IKA-2]|nr:hypothetical protein RJD24_06490 [Bacillaceae bacterium IKA-2]